MTPVGYGTNMTDVNVISQQTLSLPEREIKYMIDSSLRLPASHNFSLKSASLAAAAVDQLDAQQAPQVPWLHLAHTARPGSTSGSTAHAVLRCRGWWN